MRLLRRILHAPPVICLVLTLALPPFPGAGEAVTVSRPRLKGLCPLPLNRVSSPHQGL